LYSKKISDRGSVMRILHRFYYTGVLIAVLSGLVLFNTSGWAASSPLADYVVLVWNDLGIHCINRSFATIAILPPFNNVWAQVIKRGEPPQIVTSGISLEYQILNNTKVQGKTDFWQYAPQLFGVNLPLGIGLTGNGLSGKMQLVGDHFEATGIPVVPFDDQMNWNPYQTVIVTLKPILGKPPTKNQIIQMGRPVTTQAVLPVSDELNCAKCHAQDMDGTINLPLVTDNTGQQHTGTTDIDQNILMVHDLYHGSNGISDKGSNLVNSTPVLCSSCHSSNALGTPGNPGTQSLSRAMHGWHKPTVISPDYTRCPDVTCYDCHPGATTQCLRTGVGGMGYLGTVPSCQTGLCHGGSQGMADSLAQGRRPWLDEPTCEQCHGSNYSTGQDLYRKAKGHGGVYCAGCHNSPHAWFPSKLWADNAKPMTLQKSPIAIGNCLVCHTTTTQAGNNPHVTYYLTSP
jgi:hypothetical protein